MRPTVYFRTEIPLMRTHINEIVGKARERYVSVFRQGLTDVWKYAGNYNKYALMSPAEREAMWKGASTNWKILLATLSEEWKQASQANLPECLRAIEQRMTAFSVSQETDARKRQQARCLTTEPPYGTMHYATYRAHLRRIGRFTTNMNDAMACTAMPMRDLAYALDEIYECILSYVRKQMLNGVAESRVPLDMDLNVEVDISVAPFFCQDFTAKIRGRMEVAARQAIATRTERALKEKSLGRHAVLLAVRSVLTHVYREGETYRGKGSLARSKEHISKELMGMNVPHQKVLQRLWQKIRSQCISLLDEQPVIDSWEQEKRYLAIFDEAVTTPLTLVMPSGCSSCLHDTDLAEADDEGFSQSQGTHAYECDTDVSDNDDALSDLSDLTDMPDVSNMSDRSAVLPSESAPVVANEMTTPVTPMILMTPMTQKQTRKQAST